MTTLLELVGFVLFAAGFWLIFPPLGLIVGGALLVLAAYLADVGRRANQ